MNLIEELGRQYITERFDQCMFYDSEGRPCVLRVASRWNPEDGVPIDRFSGTPENVETSNDTLDPDFFKDLSVLAVPQLGWRSTAEGKYTVYYSRNNASYHRGLANKNLLKYISPLSQYMLETESINGDNLMTYQTDVMMVMKPQFETLKSGIEKLRAGELVSFSVSPIVAVFPSKNGNLSVYFNTRPVAVIDKDNNINSTNDVIRQYLRSHQ